MPLFITLIILVLLTISLPTNSGWYGVSVLTLITIFGCCWQLVRDRASKSIIDTFKESVGYVVVALCSALLFALFLACFVLLLQFNATLCLVIYGSLALFGLYTAWQDKKKDMAKKRTEIEREQKWQEQQEKWARQRQEQEKRQQGYERGNYYGTFEHTKQTLQSLMKDNNIGDFFTFAYLAQNENITNYRKLGYLYENGYGTEEKDYIKAMKYYQKANAWREIGYMHYFGYGVPKNKDKANEYFAKCADIEDCKKVISYFERIANNSNDANALCNLGWHYAEGKGISQDYHKALYYYQKAADLGNKIACNNLGNCYEYDKLYVLFSQYKALKYYKKACDLGNQKGCENFRRLKNEMGIRLDLFDLDCFTDSQNLP